MEFFSSYKKNCKKKFVAKVLHIVLEAADDKPLTVFASPKKEWDTYYLLLKVIYEGILLIDDLKVSY